MEISDDVARRLRKDHFGLSYSEFLHMVCDGCNACYLGEEKCERLTRMSREFGF